MSRIFAPNDGHNYNAGGVLFQYGAAALPLGSVIAAEFAAAGYTVDTAKHELTPFDILSRTELDKIAAYLGLTLDPDDGKYEVVRDIEGVISTAKRTALTVTSVAGTASGDTKITVAGEGTGQLVYKITDVALSPLYRDYAGDWTEFTDGDDITAATGKKVNVAELDAGGSVLGFGSATVTAKA